jgi:hypothetical protein
MANPTPDSELRRTERGNVYDAALVRSFIHAALAHDAVSDLVNDLLYTHVVERRYHPSVVAASLHPILTDVLDAATAADWQQVSDELASEAREALGEPARNAADAHRPEADLR